MAIPTEPIVAMILATARLLQKSLNSKKNPIEILLLMFRSCHGDIVFSGGRFSDPSECHMGVYQYQGPERGQG